MEGILLLLVCLLFAGFISFNSAGWFGVIMMALIILAFISWPIALGIAVIGGIVWFISAINYKPDPYTDTGGGDTNYHCNCGSGCDRCGGQR